MKKLFKIAVIAIAAIASFSCAKEITPEIEDETEEVVVKEGFKLHAEVDSELTKTVLSGTSILWGETDAVKAFGDNVYTSTSIERTNGNKTAEFTFGPLEDGDDVLFALYPAINAGGTDYDNMEITIPAEQVATVDSFDPAAMAAIGEIDGDYKIAFKNIGALLSIVINNDDIASVELSATEESGASMTGTAAVEMDGAGDITTVTDGSSTRVKLKGGLNNGETYYFVIYPGTYSNLRIVVTDTDGAIAVYRNKTQFTVERNENWKIAELTIPDGKWEPAEVEVQAFYESFDAYNGTGANDGLWSGYIANTSWNPALLDNAGWTSPGGVRMANKCVRIGGGSITTPHLGITEASVGLSFKAAAWDDAEEKTTMRVTVEGQGKIKIGETEYTDYDFSIVKGSWSTLSAKVIGANTDTRLTFESQGSKNRFFLDEVKLFTVTARDDTPIHYTVTYDTNTGAGEVPSDATDYNDQTNFIVTVADRGELTKTGHSFNGWNTAADGSGTAYTEGDTFVINNNITLYAQWTPIVYAITKNVNAHCNYTVKAGGVEVSTATYGTSLSLEADTPDAGYSFNKFHIDYTKENGTPGESNFTDNPKPYTMPASNITITLILDEVYAVVWKVGSTTYQSDVVASGNDLTLPTPPDPEAVGYPGYCFIGWTAASSVNSDGTSITYAANGDAVTADVTYHAVFATPASLNEVSSSYTLTVGDELVIVANDGSSDYGLYEETVNTSYIKNFAFTNSASDIAADAKKHWTVSKINDKYYLGDDTNGYLYNSSQNDLASNKSNKTIVTLIYDSTEKKFTIIMNNRWLSLRNDLTGSNNNLWSMGGSTSRSPSGVVYFKVYKFTPASGSLYDYTL